MPSRIAEKSPAEIKPADRLTDKGDKGDKADKADKSAGVSKAQSAARQGELEAAINIITKAYGDGSIMRLGYELAKMKIDVIPTGALAVDLALGVGGLPRGR